MLVFFKTIISYAVKINKNFIYLFITKKLFEGLELLK
jgi:hypothetical protein